MIALRPTGHTTPHFFCLLILFGALLTGCASQNRPPILVKAAPLEYPLVARENGVEGSVRVRYSVGVDGRVSDVRVIASEPEGVFDVAAVIAVSAWRFSPAMVNGETSAVSNRESTLTFRLGDTDKYQRD